MEETEEENEAFTRPAGLVEEAGKHKLGCGLDRGANSEGNDCGDDGRDVNNREGDCQSIENSDEEEL